MQTLQWFLLQSYFVNNTILNTFNHIIWYSRTIEIEMNINLMKIKSNACQKEDVHLLFQFEICQVHISN